MALSHLNRLMTGGFGIGKAIPSENGSAQAELGRGTLESVGWNVLTRFGRLNKVFTSL
jgi:hypothetical protein